MKASLIYTWLVKTLHNVLSSFVSSLVLFYPLGLGFFCTWTSLLSVSQRRQPSAAFSTRLHKTRTLRRTSRTVLPVLRCQETPFFPVLDPLSLDLVPRPRTPHRQCIRRISSLHVSSNECTYVRTYARTLREQIPHSKPRANALSKYVGMACQKVCKQGRDNV